jgi:ubiquinone/menaquinone biosynthesis C-methylase UbiE
MRIVSEDFYAAVSERLLDRSKIQKSSSMLIVAGGERDKGNFQSLGFSNVTISNLDERMDEKGFAPYQWSFQDAESLTYSDEEFDYVVIHAGIHHCYSPHKAMLEAYRVAKLGVLIFDGRDNLITKLGTKLGLGETHELQAVYDHGFGYGGVANTGIPNFVYRWTENEVTKTIASNNPATSPDITFFYGLEVPFTRLAVKKNKLFYYITKYGYPFLFSFFYLFYKHFGNRFAFYIKKSKHGEDLHPWLVVEKGQLQPNKTYISSQIKKSTLA